MLKILFFIFGLCLSVSVNAADGLISIKSNFDVEQTADKLEEVLLDKGMTVFTRVKHSQAAWKINKKLRPTELVIFGNPKIGTLLMQCQQTVAIDLPQKALVSEDENGDIWLSYNDPDYLTERHDIKDCAEVSEKIKKALANFATAATQ